ncbi:MAG: alpha/beta hydrolase-fold protein [Bacillota bacterium]
MPNSKLIKPEKVSVVVPKPTTKLVTPVKSASPPRPTKIAQQVASKKPVRPLIKPTAKPAPTKKSTAPAPIPTVKLFKTNKSGSEIYVIENFYLPMLNRTRKLWVYLPPSYYNSKKDRFSTIYINDGQNLFEDCGNGCWEVAKKLDEYFAITGKGCIAVGIDNGEELRADEYLPWIDGEYYANDWRNAIYPYINEKYRTRRSRKHTGFLGSSLGATILLEFLAHHQDLIGKFGFFSLAVEVDYDELMEMAEGIEFDDYCRLYFDIGETEGSSQGEEEIDDEEFIFRTNEIVTILKENSHLPSLFVLDTAHPDHSESSWEARLLLALHWLQDDSGFDDEQDELVI